MTAQNEEKMREAFDVWCERTRQARAYHSGVIVVEPTDDNYCIWKAAISQGEQERKRLQESPESEKSALDDFNNKVCARNEELHIELAAAERKLAEQAGLRRAFDQLCSLHGLHEWKQEQLSEAEQRGYVQAERDALMKELSEPDDDMVFAGLDAIRELSLANAGVLMSDVRATFKAMIAAAKEK